ncbi:General stress protein 69 [compost metagenome]
MSDQIKIGNSEVFTEKLGLGTNKVGGHNLFTGLEDNNGYKIIQTALDNGIRHLDTAYLYGLGHSEEIIGDVVQHYNRSQIVIATKAAHDPSHDSKINNHPDFLTKSIDEALLRLKTEYLDVFYIHVPDGHTPKADAVGALQRAREAGKIRAIGLSNFSLDQIEEANVDGYVDIVEDQYNLVFRNVERNMFSYLKENCITFVPYFPLASGLLTGKYQKNHPFSEDSWQFTDENFKGERFNSIIDAVDKVKPLAEKYNASVANLILSWYLNNPDIGVIIPGASSAQQVIDNLQAKDITLSPQDYKNIDVLFQNF